ncbi:MAG: hypothetical protein RDU83_01610 [bacterium]|nr:hypothetical protein [bacterium]
MPRDLVAELTGHEVRTIAQMGWKGLENGELLARNRIEALQPLVHAILRALAAVRPGEIQRVGA